ELGAGRGILRLGGPQHGRQRQFETRDHSRLPIVRTANHARPAFATVVAPRTSAPTCRSPHRRRLAMEVLYRAHATASGGGREDGRSRTDDGKVDVKLSTPTEMGGKGGDGTNPEQLFATGYAACYLGALRLVSGKAGSPVGPDTKVQSTVGFGKNTKGEGF